MLPAAPFVLLGPLDGARVLLPQADIADPGLADELRARGATVNAVAAYRTVLIEPAMSGILPLRVADAIVLASPSAARSLASLSTSLGAVPGRVAEEATSEGIIQTLVSYYEEL